MNRVPVISIEVTPPVAGIPVAARTAHDITKVRARERAAVEA